MVCIVSIVSNQALRLSTRKSSSSRVRCSRSTIPLDCGRLNPGPLVLDPFELEEQHIRVLFLAAAILAAVGMRVARAWQPVEQSVRAIGLEVAASLAVLLAAIGDHLAGFGHVAKVGPQLEQAQLATCYFLFHGHVALRRGFDVARNTILTPARSGMATPVPRPRQSTVGRSASVAKCPMITVSAHADAATTGSPLSLGAIPVEISTRSSIE